jgi:hypothetical protein
VFRLGIVARIYMFAIILFKFAFFSACTFVVVANALSAIYDGTMASEWMLVMMFAGVCLMHYLAIKIYRMNVAVFDSQQNALEEYIESIFR